MMCKEPAGGKKRWAGAVPTHWQNMRWWPLHHFREGVPDSRTRTPESRVDRAAVGQGSGIFRVIIAWMKDSDHYKTLAASQSLTMIEDGSYSTKPCMMYFPVGRLTCRCSLW